MAVLTIRKVPEAVRERLRLRAARAGTSMEAEARAILIQGSLQPARRASPRSLQAWVDKLYGKRKPAGVVDSLLAQRRREARAERSSR
jgi:plasmid stability protein